MRKNLPSRLTPLAKTLRKNSTDVEQQLWYRIRDRQIGNAKFKRQFPIGNYIVDFCCYEAKLIVELDGSQHADSQSDKERDTSLHDQGYRVLRIWNNEVIENMESVLEKIYQEVTEDDSRSVPLPSGDTPPVPLPSGGARGGNAPAPDPYNTATTPPSPQPSPTGRGSSIVLKKITTTNFRNLADLALSFETPVIAFVGENAQGKTNILEAISVLALGKSLRAASDLQLVQQSCDFFRLTGELASGTELTLAQSKAEKKCTVSGSTCGVADFVGQLPLVAFWPEDMNLVLLGPAPRRRYLDILLSQVSHTYLASSLAYARALRQRNALLGRIGDGLAQEDELTFWDTELATHGLVVGQLRAEFVAYAAEHLDRHFRTLSQEDKELTARLTGFRAEELTQEKYLENLAKLRDKDLRYGSTQYGPHRSDLVFELGGQTVAENGSRGEIRSTILALTFAELAFLEERTGTRPLLLLDDVFSELDRGRQERLMAEITGYQVFITTTKREHLDAVPNATVWEITNGTLNLAS